MKFKRNLKQDMEIEYINISQLGSYFDLELPGRRMTFGP